jgi:putative hydrolase of the HAD superfamily
MIIKYLNKIPAQQIKNIIFDWGGVIINIDYQATIDAFNQLGNLKFEEYYTQATQQHLFDLFETGKISEAEFLSKIKNEFGNGLSNENIVRAWCAMLKDIPRARIETLKRLGKTFRIFLLSNTNSIHERIIVQRLNHNLGFEFFSLFEKVYLSHRLGMRKPNAPIFEHVLKENNLDSSETLFIDDSEQHVVGASKVGIPSFHLQPEMDITDIFANW